MRIPVIAIFDIGKTNKKLFLFDENYKIVFEKSTRFNESEDEDGFPCEDLANLRLAINNSLLEIFGLTKFKVEAINFSTYGASLVYLGNEGKPLAPLYNYLKPYPKELSRKFFQEFGNRENLSLQTSSPILGSLNSGFQLYRFKYEKADIFRNLVVALHLPQYLSSLLTGRYYSDITSIGCHTFLWDFKQNAYHSWVKEEKLIQYLAPLENSSSVFSIARARNKCKVGIGMHDSSAALVPYLLNFTIPFILISTGTWCISMNPFNHSPLTSDELKNDCLCFMQYSGVPVKASRLNSGLEYERGINRIADYFQQDVSKYNNISFRHEIVHAIRSGKNKVPSLENGIKFCKRDLSGYTNDIEAYHQLVVDIVDVQLLSTQLVIGDSQVKRIFVDGGFSNNSVFMHLLAEVFPDFEVFAASMAQATAVGAALAIHKSWSTHMIPSDIIELKYYSSD